MKPPIFIDTWYLIALLSTRDEWHASARRLTEQFAVDRPALLTTDAVLVELGNYYCRREYRRRASQTIARLRAIPDLTIVPMTTVLLARAEKRYAHYLDKEWSLTDCLSMEVMHDARAIEIATRDEHFTQAGFRVLL